MEEEPDFSEAEMRELNNGPADPERLERLRAHYRKHGLPNAKGNRARKRRQTVVELFGQRARLDGGVWKPMKAGEQMHVLLNFTLPPYGFSPSIPHPHKAAVDLAKAEYGDALKVISIAPPYESEEGVIY